MLTRDHGGTGHQVWLPTRGGDEEVSSPPIGLRLTSAGERRRKALRGPSQGRHQGQSWWNQRVQTSHACSTWWCRSLPASSGGSRGFKPVMALLGRDWVNPAYFHNSFLRILYCILFYKIKITHCLLLFFYFFNYDVLKFFCI